MARSAFREETQTCSNCGSTQEPNNRFCPSCGVIRAFANTQPSHEEFWYAQASPPQVKKQREPWTPAKILNRSLAAGIVIIAFFGMVTAMESASRAARSGGALVPFADTQLDQFESALNEHDYALASQIGNNAVNTELKSNQAGLNTLAWDIVKPEAEMQDSDRDLKLATKAAERAVSLNNRKSGGYLDTLAWCYFREGLKAKAIDTQIEALSKARSSNLSNLEDSLKAFRAGSTPSTVKPVSVPADQAPVQADVH